MRFIIINRKMLQTLNGMFSKPKPHRVDFIKENKKKLREYSSMVNQDHSKSRFEATKSKGSQTDVKARGSSSGIKEIKTKTCSGSRLGNKSSMVVYFQGKKNKKSISNVSLSTKQKSSQKLINLKNQSCQTIDPRRCDQLFHEGVIKYPSEKVLNELAQIEKQKANRLDVHIKKEYFRRNKLKSKLQHKIISPFKNNPKVTEKGDEAEEKNPSEYEEEEEEVEVNENENEKENENEEEEVIEPEPQNINKLVKKPIQKQTLRASEIIKVTTEEHAKYNPKNQTKTEQTSHNKDEKVIKKIPKKTKEEEVAKPLVDPQCPPGHIPLPDVERKKTLHMLRVSHAELVKEMNLLPVRTDTLRVRQKKMQLENQLNKIEEGIKVFSKSKVYVKIEE